MPTQGNSEGAIEVHLHLIRLASNGLLLVDSSGRISAGSLAVAEALGYSPDEIPHLTLFQINPYITLLDWRKEWSILEKSGGKTLHMELINRQGVIFPVEASAQLVLLRDGELACCLSFPPGGEKPLPPDAGNRDLQLEHALERVKSLEEQLEEQITYLQEESASVKEGDHQIVTQDTRYKKILRQIAQVAETDSTILLLGETGTGKGLLARFIHSVSRRSERQLITINCATLPENLIESELFGHEKGAFTGAFQQKIGRFELAHKGTLFLDEIGELPLHLQAKLLRVLQEGEFERVGGTKTLKVDVRIIAATNRNLEQLVALGRFRQDLFYRLNVFPVYNMPLRERNEDIPLLVHFFARKYGEKTGRKVTKIPQRALDRLVAYQFPGNIRELENIVERAVVLSFDETLNLNAVLDGLTYEQGESTRIFVTFEEMQRQHIIEALRRTKGKISGNTGAGRLLGLNDKTLVSKIQKLGIRKEDYLE